MLLGSFLRSISLSPRTEAVFFGVYFHSLISRLLHRSVSSKASAMPFASADATCTRPARPPGSLSFGCPNRHPRVRAARSTDISALDKEATTPVPSWGRLTVDHASIAMIYLILRRWLYVELCRSEEGQPRSPGADHCRASEPLRDPAVPQRERRSLSS